MSQLNKINQISSTFMLTVCYIHFEMLKIKMAYKPSQLFENQPVKTAFLKTAFITENRLDQIWAFKTDMLLETELVKKI